MKIYLRDDWIRAVYYDRMKELMASGKIFDPLNQGLAPKVLEWAECEGIIPKVFQEVWPRAKTTLAPYPKYDVQMYYTDWRDTFDAVVLDQVLEHVPDFWTALESCVDYLAPGGCLFCGTPWLYPYHAAPRDFWRFSVDAYKLMFGMLKLEIVEIGGWGHQKAIIQGNIRDAFLSAGRCGVCGEPKRGDPSVPCACGCPLWKPNRTVEEAGRLRLFDEPNDLDHAIEVWAVGRRTW